MKRITYLRQALVCGLFAMSFSACAQTDFPHNAVIDNILTRHSVRSYQDRAVSNDTIMALLHAGMAAPSGVDRRPWHFIVVTDAQQRARLAEANPNGGYVKDAPLAIVVCGDMDKALEGGGRQLWIQDCSAASENILLAAHSLGLGAVWTSTYPNPERQKSVKAVLGLPDNILPLNVIVIGYPKDAGQPRNKWSEDDYSVNRYEEK
ncbi:MAG: nitroreductase family protein [Prevotella sp.]|jgi:nitroreductase